MKSLCINPTWLVRLCAPLLSTIALDALAGHPTNASPAELYQAYCSVCHGERGDGQSRARSSLRPAPRDFTTEESRKMLSREGMIAIVREGRAGTAMAGWKTQLNDQQIAAVVDFIRERFMQIDTKSKPPPALANVSKAAPLLTGNAERGKRLYSQNCVACHGAAGKGDGPRAYFIEPKPRNFHTPDSRAMLDRAALVQGISYGRPGKEMPAWEKVMAKQDIADVAEYVYTAFVRPSP